MKIEEENKTEKCSFRVSAKDKKIIEENARKAGMSVSNYIITRCTKPESHITPELMVKLQDITNFVCSLVLEKDSYIAGYLREEVKTLWSLLK